MLEFPDDPFADAWKNIKHALGMDVSHPKGGLECIRDSFQIVPLVRDRISGLIDFFSTES